LPSSTEENLRIVLEGLYYLFGEKSLGRGMGERNLSKDR
jgi:hypothetical protein